MLGREHEERDAPQRVRPGREHRDPVTRLLDLERDLGAVRAADPVALLGEDAIGPVELGHVVQQPIGVVGDLEEPLRQIPPDDRRPAALAPPLDDLLVREDRLVLRAPVGRRQLPIGEAIRVELQEQPLRPAVVVGVGRRELARPVERHAVAAEGSFLLGDVAIRPGTRVQAALDRRVLRRQAEGVPADRMQDVHALHPAVTGDDVANRKRLGVPHVQVARRVGEHVQLVEAGAPVVFLDGAEEALLLPDGLPLRLDLFGVVAIHDDPLRVALPWPSSAGMVPRACRAHAVADRLRSTTKCESPNAAAGVRSAR